MYIYRMYIYICLVLIHMYTHNIYIYIFIRKNMSLDSLSRNCLLVFEADKAYWTVLARRQEAGSPHEALLLPSTHD